MFITKKNYFHIFLTLFLAFFSTLPSTQTFQDIGLIFFFNELPWKIGLWTYISTLYLYIQIFFLGGGRGTPRLYIDSDPQRGLKSSLVRRRGKLNWDVIQFSQHSSSTSSIIKSVFKFIIFRNGNIGAVLALLNHPRIDINHQVMINLGGGTRIKRGGDKTFRQLVY